MTGGVLVVVGTDAHPFDRLMVWLERWYARRPEPPDLLVQHGHSRAPDVPGAVGFLTHEQLRVALEGAALVVSHGGPASIIEARRAGRLPVVVARDPRLGEHVDDHQQRFARRLAQADMIRLCASEPEFAAALDDGLAEPDGYRLAVDPADGLVREQAVAQVGRIIDELVRRRRRTAAG